jgi:hypothetical protein
MTAARRAFAGALACAIAMSMSGVAHAEDLDGQQLFRENCKSCHEADSPNGEYTPMSLIQDQWKRFFDRKYERKHKDLDISPEVLEAIKKFAIDHAADSENPMTCG